MVAYYLSADRNKTQKSILHNLLKVQIGYSTVQIGYIYMFIVTTIYGVHDYFLLKQFKALLVSIKVGSKSHNFVSSSFEHQLLDFKKTLTLSIEIYTQ